MSTLSLLRFSPLLSKPHHHHHHHHHLLTPSPSLKTLTTFKTLTPLKKPNPNPKRPTTSTISMSYNYSPTPSTDRLISALSYTLPFINSIAYGRFLFAHFPPLLHVLTPFFPLISFLHSVPFAGFIAFFALYLGVVRNPSFSRFVRFNAMQAVVLDVLIAIPSLIQKVFGFPMSGVWLRMTEFAYGSIFVFAATCFVYGVTSCVLGRTPYLPIVASAADRQL